MLPDGWKVFAVLAALLAGCSTEDASGSSRPGPPPSTEEEWSEILIGIRERFPDVRQLSTDDYAAEAAGTDPAPMLVDVRPPAEYEVAWIPGAVNIPGGADLVARFAEVPVDREIVLYCSVGWRSSEAATELQRAGFTRVRNLEGSIFWWANADRPLVNAAGPAATVHPFDRKWGRLLRPERRAR